VDALTYLCACRGGFVPCVSCMLHDHLAELKRGNLASCLVAVMIVGHSLGTWL
jgi:hypothetical protein